jgi:regulator of protease activity HflC (stomatin/prohibitin superfamily)
MRYEVKNITPSQDTIKNMEQKMESERLRREQNIKAEGERDSVRLESEGQRQSEINVSQGSRQATINLAEGRAREIQLVADASAQATRRIAEAASKPGGDIAIRTQLVQQLVGQLREVMNTANVSVLPADLASLRSVTEAAFGRADGKQSTQRQVARSGQYGDQQPAQAQGVHSTHGGQ